MSSRVKIPVNFGFSSNPNGTTPTYISSASGSFTSEAANVLEPVNSVTVTVNVRSTNAPATVYQAETGTATYTTLSTDSQGNVPGWVNPGSYLVTASPSGGFAGATVAFEAVRGDGVTNVASGAIDMAQLAADVLSALLPTGAVLDFAGQSCPNGFCFGDSSVYPIGVAGSTYYNLYQQIGTSWNQGNEGSGNFRVPDLRGIHIIGAGTNATVATSAYTLGAYNGSETTSLNVGQLPSHTHGVNDPSHGHSIYDPTHAHGVADPGHAHNMQGYNVPINPGGQGWGWALVQNIASYGVAVAYNNNYRGGNLGGTGAAGVGIGIYGAYTGIGIYGSYTGISNQYTGSNSPVPLISPYAVLNRIIKL